MIGTTIIKGPSACTHLERSEFARLVRFGFDGSDDGLLARIRDAKWLAFHYGESNTLNGIAGLKVPADRQRANIFEKAAPDVDSEAYELELGWVYVAPDQRGNGIATDICRRLMDRERARCVFATTRSDNNSMIKILRVLGFERVGREFPHRRRKEQLVLYLRA
ncbi:MAG: GNAT family N-acetyltransferase [Gemmatimonadota bacterium]|nr:MAG: GNAT family N-acetyltransferase [Gemmatimonadota bacterium]